jgi:hypothetical protein
VRDFLNNLPPHVSGGLIALLSSAATAIVGYHTDATGFVQIPKDTLVQVLGYTGSIFLGLLVYSFSVSEKLGKKDERKARVKKWREDVYSYRLLDFYKTQSYLDLNELLTKRERGEVSKNNTRERIIHATIGIGGTITASTNESRILACYKKAINRIEKEWDLI